MTRSHDAIIDNQFGPRAAAYVQSTVHASGEDLDLLEAIIAQHAPKRALDLGSGGGHVAYRLARHAAAVVASDLSPGMLKAVATTAQERGLLNIETRVAAAERLPFDDATFDCLACRFSAHHWHDFEAGLREARRVSAPGSTVVFIDAVSPGPAALDTHLQTVELLRDPSHVRDYTAAEWSAALTRAGFIVQATRTWRLRMEYATWVQRMQTPEVNQRAIRALQQVTSGDVSAHFAIEPDGSFLLDTLLIECVAGRIL